MCLLQKEIPQQYNILDQMTATVGFKLKKYI